jgi:DNA-directed RNA polymerase subunit L
MNYIELPSKNALCFRLSGVDKSFVNALRRTLIGNIPILVLKPEDCVISVNTSRFTNEIIKARLACIPVHSLTTTEEHKVEISEKNDSQNLMYLTTKHFKCEKKLFPSYENRGLGRIHDTHIEFLRLRRGEELVLSCKTSVGTANESGMYNSVGTCAFSFTHDASASDDEWSKNPRLDTTKENWDLLEAKRFTIPNTFDFILQTVGVFPNEILLKYASAILIAQFEHFKSPEVSPSVTTIKNCYDVKLTGDYNLKGLKITMNGDYSIGKMLEYQLFLTSPTYVSFFKKHPHDPYGILRIAYKDASPEMIVDAINTACDACISQLTEFSTFVKV